MWHSWPQLRCTLTHEAGATTCHIRASAKSAQLFLRLASAALEGTAVVGTLTRHATSKQALSLHIDERGHLAHDASQADRVPVRVVAHPECANGTPAHERKALYENMSHGKNSMPQIRQLSA